MKTLKFSEEAVAALNHCLTNTRVEGRSKVRLHSQISREMIKNCTEKSQPIQVNNVVKFVDSTIAKSGSIEITGEAFEFLKNIVDDKIKEGLTGQLVLGYDDLYSEINGEDDENNFKNNEQGENDSR